jgi:hypothetical protein
LTFLGSADPASKDILDTGDQLPAIDRLLNQWEVLAEAARIVRAFKMRLRSSEELPGAIESAPTELDINLAD